MNKKSCCLPHDYQKKICRRSRSKVKCSSPVNVTVPAAAAASTFVVASLELNLKRFCKPYITLEFSSNIFSFFSFVEIDFQIFKQCQSQLTPVIVSPIWTYQRLSPGADGSAFTFFTCDCDSQSCECCTYTVAAVIRPNVDPDSTLSEGSMAGIPIPVNTTGIRNAMLSAVVIEPAE